MTEFTGVALRGGRLARVFTMSRPTAGDVTLGLGVLAMQTALALTVTNDGHRPDALGWTLLIISALALVSRRVAPMATTVVVVLAVGPYHSLDYAHFATVPAGVVALYALAVGAPPLRALLALSVIVAAMTLVMSSSSDSQDVSEMLRGSGWLLAVVVIGIAIRTHRSYVAAIVERAERAERTREEEAARRVAEERLRIARDLHDLLAHSITLIGVQTSVAAHVLVADPDRLDRETVAKALDSIADTCRDARAELRTTLQVLRAGDPDPSSDATRPPPGLAGLSDLAKSAEAAGARVTLDFRLTAADASAVPPAVGAAAYRIVQEALTNAVRHAGPDVRTVATVERVPLPWADGEALRVTVTDDGPPYPQAQGSPHSQAQGPRHPQAQGLRRARSPEPASPLRESISTAGRRVASSTGGAARGSPGGPGQSPTGPGAAVAGPSVGAFGATGSGGTEGFGIAGMQERARSVGGTVTAGRRVEAPGFAVQAVLPLGSEPHGGRTMPRIDPSVPWRRIARGPVAEAKEDTA